MQAPVSLYIVHHPACDRAAVVARSLYDWFRLGYLSGDQSGAGLPVHYRRQLDEQGALLPSIDFEGAALNVVIVLVDEKLVVCPKWRSAVVALAQSLNNLRYASPKQAAAGSTSILIPAAMHDSFYRTGPLYEGFNPIRLIGMENDAMERTLRRSVTEATARAIRGEGFESPPPLNVFLSHAKKDGQEIAKSIRDGVRNFGQLVAWYDANDLPYGAAWESPMERAAGTDTAAMIVTMTDTYPTRPWCRKEAQLARTPKRLEKPKGSQVWRVQPVVAVHQPGTSWVRGVPMLDGVPRIGWKPHEAIDMTEQIVDRLVLEVLLGLVHRKVALNLEKTTTNKSKSCYITWVPDAWTLASLRREMGRKASSIDRIVYPGYGLTAAEIEELRPVLETFKRDTRLVSFEEVMP